MFSYFHFAQKMFLGPELILYFVEPACLNHPKISSTRFLQTSPVENLTRVKQL